MLNRLVLVASLAVFGVYALAAPPVALFSTVGGADNSKVPGQSNLRFVWAGAASEIPAFQAFRVSPSGQNWVAIARVGTLQLNEEALLVGTGWTAPFVTVPVRANRQTPWGSIYEDFENSGGVAINDSGQVVFAGNDVSASNDDFLATLSGQTVTRIRTEGALASGNVFTGTRYSGPFRSVNIDSVGKVYFRSDFDNVRQAQYAGEVVRYMTDFTAIREINNNLTTIARFFDDSFRVSDDGTRSAFVANLRIPVDTFPTCLIVDGRVVVQQNRVIPGSGMTEEVDKINTRIGYSSQGNYIAIGSNEMGSFGQVDWVFSNGRVLARRSEPITPTSPYYWFDGVVSDPFQMVAINNRNETVIGGQTTDSNPATRVKLVCNERVMLSTGDEVDMNGNGTGDGVFIDSFYPDYSHLDDRLFFTCVVKLRNATSRVGDALLRYKVPLPGDIDNDDEVGPSDFALLSQSFGTFHGDPGYNPSADMNDDGSVGPADFSILQTHFGRFR